MSPLLAPYVKAIEAEAATTLEKLGRGAFGNDQSAKELVEYRRGLLKAADIIRTRSVREEDDDKED